MGKAEKRKYYLWGTGKIARQLNLEHGYILQQLDILGYIDNNPEMWGKQFEGKNVFSPEILNQVDDAYLVIANAFENEIIEQIKGCLMYDVNRIEKNFFERIRIIERYNKSEDEEKREIATWLMENPLGVYNYEYVKKYSKMQYEVEYDVEKDLFFAIYEGKRMYFSRAFHTKERAESYYRWLCMEQDIESPHRYIKDIDELKDDLVILDAGTAEGNFSLALIEKAKKVYLFEPDEDWVEALRYTFEPYAERVEIITKALSDYESVTTTTIDSVIKDNIDIIKMDVEGEEIYALRGGERVVSNSPDLRCFVCTYHQEFAFDVIESYMKQKGYETESSKGYMWFPENPFSFRDPILRKGVIRTKTKNK